MSDSVEEWARAFIESQELSLKCYPGAPPQDWEEAPVGRDLSPGRPPELEVTRRLPESAKLSALREPLNRARLMHQFWHHELQAAELMAWALLRFPDSPLEFRKGLLGILGDEVRHMSLYEGYLVERGFHLGQFPVRDWIWARVEGCSSPLEFVALLGMGFEGANLDHAARYVERFDAVGDEQAAEIQRQVGLEEVAHVRFAVRWFRTWAGEVDFAAWRALLPEDLGPLQVRGKNLSTRAREKAGMPTEFLDQLSAWGRRP